jgi:hypothetical protein
MESVPIIQTTEQQAKIPSDCHGKKFGQASRPTGLTLAARTGKGQTQAMKFEIRRTRNGVVLRVEPDFPDEKSEEVVYQERDDDEIEAFADFLRYLVDHYGPTTSRYSPKRIYVSVEPGDKFEEK